MTSMAQLAHEVAKLDWQLQRVARGLAFADPESVKRAWLWLTERQATYARIQQWPGFLQIAAGVAPPFAETYWADLVVERYFTLPGMRVVCFKENEIVGWQIIEGDQVPLLQGYLSI